MIDTSSIRWLFFDVGDTLLDEDRAMSDWCSQVGAKLSRPGETISGAEVYNARLHAHTLCAPDVLQWILGELEETNEATIPYDPSVYDLVKYNHALEVPFPGTTEVLKQLARKYQLGVIANQSAGTEQRLCDHGWKGLFWVCIGSAEAGVRKPDPAIFNLALKQARCAPEHAVMIGDRIDNDIYPAKCVGMQTIRLRQGLSRFQVALTVDEEPDITLETITELPQVLQ